MKTYVAEFKREYNRNTNKHKWTCQNIFDENGKSMWINGWINLDKKNIQWIMANNNIVFKIIPETDLPTIRIIDDTQSVIDAAELNANFEKYKVFEGIILRKSKLKN